jgi:hypothetical protein
LSCSLTINQHRYELLSSHLGNFVSFASQLPVTAFVATLETDTLGFSSLEGQQMKVVKHQIQLGGRWCNQRLAYELNSRTRRLVSHTSNSALPQSLIVLLLGGYDNLFGQLPLQLNLP